MSVITADPIEKLLDAAESGKSLISNRNILHFTYIPTKIFHRDSVGSKIWNIINKFFPVGKFTSSEILEKYEDEYNEPIKLAAISTYLSRFASKGRIERTRSGREWSYQTIKLTQKHSKT